MRRTTVQEKSGLSPEKNALSTIPARNCKWDQSLGVNPRWRLSPSRRFLLPWKIRPLHRIADVSAPASDAAPPQSRLLVKERRLLSQSRWFRCVDFRESL